MPQSYTIGGDSWQDIKRLDISGQTFRVLTPFQIQWVDLWLSQKPVFAEIVIQIFFAGGDHHPFGDCKSRDRVIIASESLPGGIHHVRFSMQPFLLDPLDYYCLQVNFYPPIWGGVLKWRYDAGDATYPRGHRIHSDDGGETWTDHVHDDHIFALWGTPPVPAPPPEPPINNAAIIDIEKVITETGMQLVVTTNVPCHLYAAYTLEKPLKHPNTRIVRGLPVPWDTRWCFINWTQNEQAEEGDTIIHTFTKEPWPACETRYFVFRGKVDGEWIPSASPIFTIHRVAPPYGPPVTVRFYPTPGNTGVAADGYTQRVLNNEEWSDKRSLEGNGAFPSYFTGTIGFTCGSNADTWYSLQRTLLHFDTLLLPTGCLIDAAAVHVMGYAKGNTIPSIPSLALVLSYDPVPGSIIPEDYQNLGWWHRAPEIPYADFDEAGWNVFTMPEEEFNLIIREGITKLGLKEGNYDAAGLPPPYNRYKSSYFRVRMRDDIEDYWPYLEVTYRPLL